MYRLFSVSATLRIYSENLPYADVGRPSTLALLARYRLALVLAVRPWQLDELGDLVRRLRDAGIPLSVWPMLADEQGRWANAHNADAFVRFVHAVVNLLSEADLAPNEVLLDLEPPFSRTKSFAKPPTRTETIAAERGLAKLIDEVHARGIETSSAVWPLVALDPLSDSHSGPWQALLGTPVDSLPTSRVSVMLYTSMLEGWSRGTIRRRHALALFYFAALRARRRWSERAGISLGCVGTGAFEDEPVYRNPRELAEDAALARLTGCSELSLFDLGGVLSRGRPEAWLDAFVESPSSELVRVAKSLRVTAARRFARVATWALGRATRR